MSETPYEAISRVTSEATASLVAQVDEYLIKMAEALHLTIEQMAERYELEYHPLDVVSDEPGKIRATQSIRLKRRDDAPQY